MATGIAPMACDLVNVARIVDYLIGTRKQQTTTIAVRHALQRLGARDLGVKPINGKTPQLWAIRNIARWAQASDAEIAANYVDPVKQGRESN
jgi:phosphopantothenate synthetase